MGLCIVTGNVKDLLKLNRSLFFTSGTVRFRLARQPRTTMKPVISGSNGRAAILQYDVDVNEDGSFTARVESNDGLEPEKTFYEVSFLIPTVRHEPRFYRITGQRCNLNSAVAFRPVSADVWVDDL